MIKRFCQFFFLGTFAGILLFFLLHKTILPWYAEQLYVNNATKGADAIVLLGGNPFTRIDKVIELYREKYAPLVIRTSLAEKNSKHYPHIIKTQTQLAIEVFEEEGVKHIVVKDENGGATSTFDEARLLAKHCRDLKLKRIILVTDPSHSGRATYAFEKIFAKLGVGTEVQTAATKDIETIKYDWWKQEQSLITYFFEGLKYLYYMINDRNFAYIKAG